MSEHARNIVTNHHGLVGIQVVFVDIEKYSKRRTQIQSEVIGKLTLFLRDALREVSQEFVDYTQQNDINLRQDTIVLPTGDGAAVVFSFDGLNRIHLDYALALLKRIDEYNTRTPCDSFARDGYCSDHSHFNVRIGISQGLGLIYRDYNDRYNVAGDVINMAARVMNLADRNQIVFTADAYRTFIDMADQPGVANDFRLVPQVVLKHDLIRNAFQYIGSQRGVNTSPLTISSLLDQHSKERELLTRYGHIEAAGFRKLYPNRQEFFNEFVETILENARDELKIMGICVSLFRESDKPGRASSSSRTADSLLKIIRGGCTVKVLFLKRYLSEDDRKYYGVRKQADLFYMRERDEEFDYDFRRGERLKIISNLSVGRFVRVLVDLAREARDWDVVSRGKLLDRLEIHEYVALPSLSLYIVDDDIYVTPYLCKRHCSTVPAFKVSGRPSDLFRAYQGHFEAAWNGSEAAPVIDARFIQLLITDPGKNIGLFDTTCQAIKIEEEAKVSRKPSYHDDPERYRIEEKAIQRIVNLGEGGE